jgi:hypothetical protein
MDYAEPHVTAALDSHSEKKERSAPHPLNKFCSRVVVLNLQRNPDRMQRASTELSAAGIAFERVPGVDASAMTTEELEAMVYKEAPAAARKCKRSKALKLRPGQTGCSLAHMRAWRIAAALADSPNDWVAVFEDDVSVTELASRLPMKLLLDQIPQSAQIVYLGHCRLGRGRDPSSRAPVPAYTVGGHDVEVTRVAPNVIKFHPLVRESPNVPVAGYAYMIRGSLARHILKTYDFTTAWDSWLPFNANVPVHATLPCPFVHIEDHASSVGYPQRASRRVAYRTASVALGIISLVLIMAGALVGVVVHCKVRGRTTQDGALLPCGARSGECFGKLRRAQEAKLGLLVSGLVVAIVAILCVLLIPRHGSVAGDSFASVWCREDLHAATKLLQSWVSNCSKHGVRSTLAYGTLLGARRHGGVIPWNDDLDVAVDERDVGKLPVVLDAMRREGYTTASATSPFVTKVCTGRHTVPGHRHTWPFLDIFVWKVSSHSVPHTATVSKQSTGDRMTTAGLVRSRILTVACVPFKPTSRPVPRMRMTVPLPEELEPPGRDTSEDKDVRRGSMELQGLPLETCSFQGISVPCLRSDVADAMLDSEYPGWRETAVSSEWNHRCEKRIKTVRTASLDDVTIANLRGVTPLLKVQCFGKPACQELKW